MFQTFPGLAQHSLVCPEWDGLGPVGKKLASECVFIEPGFEMAKTFLVSNALSERASLPGLLLRVLTDFNFGCRWLRG